MSNRTNKVVLSAEASVLRTLRMQTKLSMRAAGELMGYSSSYISQIENGRENPPSGETLNKFLAVYGGISKRSFKERCRRFKAEITDLDVINNLLPKLNVNQLNLVRSMIEQMLKS